MRIAESLAKMKLQAVAGEEEVDEALRLFQVSTLDAALSGNLSGTVLSLFCNEKLYGINCSHSTRQHTLLVALFAISPFSFQGNSIQNINIQLLLYTKFWFLQQFIQQ